MLSCNFLKHKHSVKCLELYRLKWLLYYYNIKRNRQFIYKCLRDRILLQYLRNEVHKKKLLSF